MTPKEKSEELLDKMKGYGDEYHHCTQYVAKQCAIILVNEVLDVIYKDWYDSSNGVYEYWEEVKEEILKT